MTQTEPQRDPVGDAIRVAFGGVAFRIGALAGVAAFLVSGLAILLITLLPYWTIQLIFDVRLTDESISVSQRISNSFTAPWSGALDITQKSFSLNYVQLPLWTSLVSIAVLVIAGLYVRRVLRFPGQRLMALITAALTIGVLVAVTALVFSFDISSGGTKFHVDHPAGRTFVQATLFALLIGVFTFGADAVLRQPVRTAVRVAAVTFAVVFTVATLVGGLAIGFGPSKLVGGTTFESRAEPHVAALNGGPAMAAAGLPLSTLAKGSFYAADDSLSPLVNSDAGNSGSRRVYWQGFNDYTEQHRQARLTSYADLGGTPAKLLLLAAAIGVLLCWAVAAAVAVRRLGAPRSLDGLRLGALVGLSGGVLQLLVGWLITAWATENVGTGSQLGFRWGTTGEASFQALAVLVVLCGISGLVYASFRSAPRTYEPVEMRVPGWMMPPAESTASSQPEPPAAAPPVVESPVVADTVVVAEAPPVPDAPVVPEPVESAQESSAASEPAQAQGPFCTACGERFKDGDERFCRNCGASRT
jgi:hypothetical protein